MKLLRLPIFCAFSAFKSILLGVCGIAGKGGASNMLFSLFSDVIFSSCVVKPVLLLFDRSDLILCLFALFVVWRLLLRLALSSVFWRSRSSIAPATVCPPVAKFSSGMGMNLMRPRSGVTPRPSSIDLAMSAALRLLVTGFSCEESAVMVKVYAGSKFPA